MYISDFKEVEMLVETMSIIEGALVDIITRPPPPPILLGAYQGMQQGQVCAIKGGGGAMVDLTGCYIREELLGATVTLLEAKKAELTARLGELGVVV